MLIITNICIASGGCPGTTEGTIELGTGTISFAPLESEQDLELEAGPQGGFHLIVHARMLDLAPGDPARPGAPENPATKFTAWDEDGNALDYDSPPYRLGYQRDPADEWWELPSGRILQIRNEVVDAMLSGTRVRLHVEARNDNVVATDERWVVLIKNF